MLGRPQLLQRKSLPFSVYAGSWRRVITLGLSRNLRRRPRNFSPQLCLKTLSQILGCTKTEKNPMVLARSGRVFSSMGIVPQRGKVSHPKTQKDFGKQCSEPTFGAASAYPGSPTLGRGDRVVPEPSGPGTAREGVSLWAAQSSVSFRDQELELGSGTDRLFCFSPFSRAKASLQPWVRADHNILAAIPSWPPGGASGP